MPLEKEEYVINVGPNGTFRKSGNYQTLPEHIDQIFQKLANDNKENITIYFHGGLVNEKNGMESAEDLSELITEATSYPICFVWETGLIETISNNISKISDTNLFKLLLNLLIKRISEELGFGLPGRGANNIDIEEINEQLANKYPFQDYTQTEFNARGAGSNLKSITYDKDLIDKLEAEIKNDVETNNELIDELKKTELPINENTRGIIETAKFIKSLAMIAFRVIKRFLSKRDHDFYPTIIEEILRELYLADLGAWVWNNMKEKSNNMWNSNNGINGLDRFAGRYFLDKLLQYSNTKPNLKVNLIGHSAGSIAICNLLNETSKIKPNFKYNKIIFMAPACRTDLFRDSIATKENRFKEFRMFTMKDKYEKQDILVPFLYTHSLLYLISGVLENKGQDFDSYLLGLERHISAIEPYNIDELKTIKDFVYKQNEHRISLSKTDDDNINTDGLKTNAVKHGEFDNDQDTRDSIVHFLQN